MADALEKLTLPKFIASSSKPDRIRLALETTKLIQYFNGKLYSAIMVKRGKPAPNSFLYAADQMKQDPENCLLIEDSVSGVSGALSAGMTVFGFVGGSHCSQATGDRLREAGAVKIFRDMKQLLAIIMEFMVQ